MNRRAFGRSLLLAGAAGTAAGASGCAITAGPLLPGQPLRNAELKRPQAVTAAHEFLREKTAFDAFAAMQGEALITRWGKADLPINTHSVRKSILSMLLGMAEARGLMSLDRTLAQMGVDEPATPLTPRERSAS